jgi:hypothetical protein
MLLLWRLVDSSVVFSLLASFGTESFWLEHDFVPSHFKLPFVCSYFAFGQLNQFFCLLSNHLLSMHSSRGRLRKQDEMCIGLYMMSV